MSRSRTLGTPSRVEARRKKSARTRIVLSVTAAAAVVAVGVAVADSDGEDRTDRQAGGQVGTASGTASATPPAAPADATPTGTPEASASGSPSASASPSATPDAGASESAAPADPSIQANNAPATSAAAKPAKPAPKPSPTKGSGSGGSGGTGTSGGSGGSGGSGTVNGDAESAVLSLVNKERATAGCGPLAANAKLSAAARAYSDTMARSGVMSHTGPDGSTMTSRVEAAGYKWSRLGENIARGQADAASVMNSWMNSSGHRANILNCDFREIGIGVHKGDGGPWWTQNFGTGK
ncbi:CAP domain-containing protein [Streptomyces antarcticus]|uniref:CAP domain-containing protein n=1 Tax=Streptomyces antarcticus TaxID=2996458 RepID=UPI00226FEAD6|nr:MULTISPECIES: CAP domain-containing protein [unclassified Streptomyces]MCY0943746.1 CAP domain-containing protein [Streptomyces sp. H34-AA3]MCY0954180.1 CAP domain-containing protein [Streptomyces sp. H27-S2]MCZ4086345.1 CAP domain-containing protein [Streptomyces sp. H34-S5]